ncbi:hypothetical protein K4043_03045 [Stenotrophomonas sp. SRS1]|uniref:hypothetical protein n=1 Tax=Stenotrophomonas sp. SRS1 TaxID=2870345 RepID=UPI002238CC15|nr:hypothetical protein [Stenotrophomonas sp. SRS1]MCW6026992.1 hypothetical protein [Stenotrophomonas sp. SRS1]
MTGPAYGVLLDRWSPRWRSGLSTTSDLPGLLADQLDMPPSASDLEDIGRGYGMDEVRAQEQERC